MIEEIASIMAPKTGILHNLIRRSLDAGKETPESKKAKEEQALEDIQRVQRTSQIYNAKGKIIESNEERVPKTYNARGQIIEYNESGRHLDIKG